MSYQPYINSLIGVLLAFGMAWFWYKKNLSDKRADEKAAEYAALEVRMREMEKVTALHGQSILPLNAAFQAILIKELTHFHTPKMDKLLVKLGPPPTITTSEEEELAVALKDREADMADEISDSERDAAHMLPLVIKRVKAEAELLAHAPTQIQLVAVAPDTDEPPSPEIEIPMNHTPS